MARTNCYASISYRLWTCQCAWCTLEALHVARERLHSNAGIRIRPRTRMHCRALRCALCSHVCGTLRCNLIRDAFVRSRDSIE